MKPNVASRQALLGLFGSLNLSSLLLITGTLVLMGIVTNLAFEALVAILQLEGWFGFFVALGVGGFILLCVMFGLLGLARRTGNRSLQSKPVKPPETDVLVMYLSPCSGDSRQQAIRELLASDDDEQREILLTPLPWYMNIKGIRNQLNDRVSKEPLKVVILRTRDIGIESLNQFRQVASKALPKDAHVHILDAWDYCPEDIKVAEEDLERDNLTNHFALVESVRRSVEKNGERVLIDVTSGTKVCSIAAAMVSLYKDQHFQYVGYEEESDRYLVQSYNVQYSDES